MKPFAILDPKTSILQKCLLEASAGTGKTFTIEHLYIRLLLEKEDFSIDNLLIVTFTKKATRELKLRIFQTLSSTLKALKEEKLPFLYLSTYLNYTAEKKNQGKG